MPGDIGENVTDPHKVSQRPNSGKRAVPLIVAVADSTRYRGVRKLALLQLARYGNPDGSAIRPALQTVADMAGLDERSIRRHVRAFETDGVLVVVAKSRGGRSKPSEYRLDLSALNPDTATRVYDIRNPDSGALNPDSENTKPGHSDPPTYQDLSRPTAPTGSAGEAQPSGADDEPAWLRIQKRNLAR